MAKNKKLVPFDPMASDQGPVKLRIPPKECEACGGKFIPTGNRQKYCPNCSRMTPKEREAVRQMLGSPSSEVTTYIDENRKKQKEEDVKEFEPIEAKPVEDIPDLAEPKKDVLEAKMDQWISDAKRMEVEAQHTAILDALEAWHSIKLIPADQIRPYKVTAGDEILFDGYAWEAPKA